MRTSESHVARDDMLGGISYGSITRRAMPPCSSRAAVGIDVLLDASYQFPQRPAFMLLFLSLRNGEEHQSR